MKAAARRAVPPSESFRPIAKVTQFMARWLPFQYRANKARGMAASASGMGKSWDEWFDGEGVSADFMNVRNQPAVQLREDL